MKKVMLVEDEELILQGLKFIIDWETLGMQVVHMAQNGAEALKLWEQEPVDLVVTDVSMPVMDGLTLLKNLRQMDERVRFVILTGYDEFEYARTAIRLDVEHYILKPINEEELEQAVKEAAASLEERDRKRLAYIDDKTGLVQFLKGEFSYEEASACLESLGLDMPAKKACAAVMGLDLKSLKGMPIAEVLLDIRNLKEGHSLRIYHIYTDTLLLLVPAEEQAGGKELLASLQDHLESSYGILSFISVSPAFSHIRELPENYRKANKLQKYRMIDGYGCCIDRSHIHNRHSGALNVDTQELAKHILKKDRQASVDYLEDLFINNIKADTSTEDLYRMAVKIAMALQDMKKEYQLTSKEGLMELADIIEGIYQARDLPHMKAVFISEIDGIIQYLHTADSQYTPVVRQILAEVEEHYDQDMNLKTLAYKYHMNTSYLGQIFQKEVGTPFSQYLGNMKNSKAKELILTTNMKITDIAREVGYPDTSYFYRKFKQCYGVSPASLREIKKY